MKIFFSTFGCKVNTFESAAMSGQFVSHGNTLAETPDTADIVVINSCTVTAGGDKKVRQYMRKIKRENPDCIMVLCGCFPQAYPEEAAAFFEADIVTGTGNRTEIEGMVGEFLTHHQRIVRVIDNADKAFEPLSAEHIDGHTRAFMKIEDGCDRFCAYCVIPYARGPVRSMPLGDVRAGAAALAASGHKELVLSGINLSFYGRGTEYGLADAVEAVCSVPEIQRVRLGSLEPDLLSDETIARLAAQPKLCPQFHLSLQSGCDRTLERMDRKYTAAEYTETAQKLRGAFDRPTFTTDVIVGFPGETEADFAESLKFVRDFGFLKVHVFPYSLRPGTKAAGFSDMVEKDVKAERCRVLSEAAEASRSEVMASFVGTTERVIAEQKTAGGFTGYTDRYLPALLSGKNINAGDVVCGKIAAVENGKVLIHVDNEG